MWVKMQRQKPKPPIRNGKVLTWKDFVKDYGISKQKAKLLLRDAAEDEVWTNDKYAAFVRRHKGRGFFDHYQSCINDFDMEMAWLSIKRHDKEVVHDWRDLQRIKNDIVGEECEGIELYPAESRLTDAANQYHLFVCTDPEVRIPVGFGTRFVKGSDEAESLGAKQRTLHV